MDRLDSVDGNLDLDIDLESGGTTSDEDSSKVQLLSGGKRREFVSVELSYGCFNSDEISNKKKEIQLDTFRETMVNFVDNNKNLKNQNPLKPPKPPRPPRGPSLDASDMKLLKEISYLNLKRKRMERIRNMKKIRREKKKASSMSSNLFALLVTVIFLLVIIFQGLLGSRV